VKVLGFTDQMDDLMAAADIVISKPGGLTTSETLARGAAMVIVNPIPARKVATAITSWKTAPRSRLTISRRWR
jgi:UDP-N-acetylglucosamine:LPS N-acetylglucosamine transferase